VLRWMFLASDHPVEKVSGVIFSPVRVDCFWLMGFSREDEWYGLCEVGARKGSEPPISV